MIFLDANVFLRAITEVTPATEAMAMVARELFRAVSRGDEEVTTSEAVLAEVAFILNAKRHYDLPPQEVAARLRPFLLAPHLRLPRGQKRLYLRALDLWAEVPRLGFVDALTAVTVEGSDAALATFDRDFDGLPGIVRWLPPEDQST